MTGKEKWNIMFADLVATGGKVVQRLASRMSFALSIPRQTEMHSLA